MKICPNCQREISDDSMFCEYCGAKQETEPQPEEPEGHEENPDQEPKEPTQPSNAPVNNTKSRSYKIPFIIALLALVVSLIWGGITYNNYMEWRDDAEQLEVRVRH